MNVGAQKWVTHRVRNGPGLRHVARVERAGPEEVADVVEAHDDHDQAAEQVDAVEPPSPASAVASSTGGRSGRSTVRTATSARWPPAALRRASSSRREEFVSLRAIHDRGSGTCGSRASRVTRLALGAPAGGKSVRSKLIRGGSVTASPRPALSSGVPGRGARARSGRPWGRRAAAGDARPQGRRPRSGADPLPRASARAGPFGRRSAGGRAVLAPPVRLNGGACAAAWSSNRVRTPRNWPSLVSLASFEGRSAGSVIVLRRRRPSGTAGRWW
jgi:hypothetical protein